MRLDFNGNSGAENLSLRNKLTIITEDKSAQFRLA